MSIKNIIDNVYYTNLDCKKFNTYFENIITINSFSNIEKYKELLFVKINDKDYLTPILINIYDFIIKSINNNEKVLVQCISEYDYSPYVCIAFLCKYNNISIEEAIEKIELKNINKKIILEIENWQKKK